MRVAFGFATLACVTLWNNTWIFIAPFVQILKNIFTLEGLKRSELPPTHYADQWTTHLKSHLVTQEVFV